MRLIAFLFMPLLLTSLTVLGIVATSKLPGPRGQTMQAPLSQTAQQTQCGIPTSVVQLSELVQQSAKFLAAAQGTTYSLQYYDQEGPETGVNNAQVAPGNGSNTTGPSLLNTERLVGGTPVYYPPAILMGFYSYGSHSVTSCQDPARVHGVVSVMIVEVPINPDGSYNMTGLQIDYTGGMDSNMTIP